MPNLDFIDVSHHQGAFPWNRARDAGVKGGICKVSDGYFMAPTYRGHIDSQFATNWQALDTFELRGAYTFIRFDANKSGGLSPAQQVKLAIDTIGSHKDRDIFVLDVEQNPTQIAHISLRARSTMLKAALQEAQKHFDNVWLYTGSWWWDKQIQITSYILSFPVWVAYYDIFPLRKAPNGWALEDVIAHQYSAKGNIAGVTTDLNEFRWDWDEYLKITPDPTPEPIPIPPAPTPPAPTPPPPVSPPGLVPPRQSWLAWLWELIVSFFKRNG